MTLGAFLCVLWMRDAEGQPVESIASLSGLSQTRPALRRGASRSSCSASPASRRCSASGPSCWCSTPRSRSGYVALAVAGIVGTVIGAYYYLQDRQGDVLGRAGRALRARPRAGAGRADPARGARSFRRSAISSSARSARSPTAPPDPCSDAHPHRRADRLDQRRPDCRRSAPIEGDWLVALEQAGGQGPAGPRRGFRAPGNFYGSTLVELRHGRSRRRRRLSLAAGLALVEAIDVAVPGQPLMLKWPNDVHAARQASSPASCSNAAATASRSASASISPTRPTCRDRQGASLGGASSRRKPLRPCSPASFARLLGLWRQSEPALIAQAWLARAHPVGTHADRPRRAATTRSAAASTGSSPTARLRLRLGDGSLDVIRAGDVEL